MTEAALELRSILDAAERAASDQDFASAERLLRDAVALQEATLDPLHPDLANTLNNLGIVCERVGKTEDAEVSYRRAYSIARATLAADDPLVATSEQNLREFCLATGTPFEREPPFVEPPTPPEPLPDHDPIADFDPPLEPEEPAAAPEPHDEISTTTAAAGTSPAPPPVAARPEAAAQTPDRADIAPETAATTAVVPAPPAPSFGPRPSASAERSHARPSPVATTPQAASSRGNVTWIVIGSVILLVVLIALSGLLSRSGNSTEPNEVSAPASTPDTAAGRTEAPAPAPASAPVPPPAVTSDSARRTPVTRDSPSTPADSGRSAAPRAANSSISVVDARLCRPLSTADWRCTPPTSPATPGVFYFYTRVKAAQNTTVQHRWYLNGNLRRTVDLRITANPGEGYRTYSRTTVPAERRGNWTIELRDAAGAILHEERFVIP